MRALLGAFVLLSIHVLAVLPPQATAESQGQVHYLKPPALEDKNWGERILCHRPMRRGAPRMDIETVGEKIVVHNYGHGGSGWTLAPGCAKYLVSQFKSRMQHDNRDQQTPIVVVGAGVLGLFSAYELVLAGYTNITIIAEQFDDLVSHRAGGFLAPSTMDVDRHMQSVIDEVCFDAYRFYAHIARGENFDFPAQGALILPIYLTREDTRLLSYEDTAMHKPQDVIVDFGNTKRYEMKVYDDGIFMDTGVMMDALRAFLQDKVRWVQKRINSFDEISAPCIFNCAGLGAQHLNHDDAMVSVQGHLILLEDQNPENMDYMISFYVDHHGVTQDGTPVKRSIYMFPKHVPGTSEQSVGVMGGTFIEEATAETPNEHEFSLIVERAREFFSVLT